eukprot:TRINITY_DN7250_c0_g1_i1.p1 TRINITY_DN7250_c0_g1~~TRINITY_DN7250_c0_g1_i1.p1  ORF type:complete len:948 (+),score=350.22 TRINITY_DN7250_c0_g1_i1:80-2845(+)
MALNRLKSGSRRSSLGGPDFLAAPPPGLFRIAPATPPPDREIPSPSPAAESQDESGSRSFAAEGGFEAAEHWSNVAMQHWRTLAEMRTQYDELRSQNEEMRAEIGELQAELSGAKEEGEKLEEEVVRLRELEEAIESNEFTPMTRLTGERDQLILEVERLRQQQKRLGKEHYEQTQALIKLKEECAAIEHQVEHRIELQSEQRDASSLMLCTTTSADGLFVSPQSSAASGLRSSPHNERQAAKIHRLQQKVLELESKLADNEKEYGREREEFRRLLREQRAEMERVQREKRVGSAELALDDAPSTSSVDSRHLSVPQVRMPRKPSLIATGNAHSSPKSGLLRRRTSVSWEDAPTSSPTQRPQPAPEGSSPLSSPLVRLCTSGSMGTAPQTEGGVCSVGAEIPDPGEVSPFAGYVGSPAESCSTLSPSPASPPTWVPSPGGRRDLDQLASAKAQAEKMLAELNCRQDASAESLRGAVADVVVMLTKWSASLEHAQRDVAIERKLCERLRRQAESSRESMGMERDTFRQERLQMERLRRSWEQERTAGPGAQQQKQALGPDPIKAALRGAVQRLTRELDRARRALDERGLPPLHPSAAAANGVDTLRKALRDALASARVERKLLADQCVELRVQRDQAERCAESLWARGDVAAEQRDQAERLAHTLLEQLDECEWRWCPADVPVKSLAQPAERVVVATGPGAFEFALSLVAFCDGACVDEVRAETKRAAAKPAVLSSRRAAPAAPDAGSIAPYLLRVVVADLPLPQELSAALPAASAVCVLHADGDGAAASVAAAAAQFGAAKELWSFYPPGVTQRSNTSFTFDPRMGVGAARVNGAELLRFVRTVVEGRPPPCPLPQTPPQSPGSSVSGRTVVGWSTRREWQQRQQDFEESIRRLREQLSALQKDADTARCASRTEAVPSAS